MILVGKLRNVKEEFRILRLGELLLEVRGGGDVFVALSLILL